MYKIKTFIIHLLGGYTFREYRDNGVNSFVDGKLAALYTAKKHAEVLNGINADAWCKDMYEYIEDNIKSIEKIH